MVVLLVTLFSLFLTCSDIVVAPAGDPSECTVVVEPVYFDETMMSVLYISTSTTRDDQASARVDCRYSVLLVVLVVFNLSMQLERNVLYNLVYVVVII